MAELEEILVDLQQAVDDANDQNYFYFTTISNYRFRDAEEAPQAELKTILSNVNRDRKDLNAKLRMANAMAQDILMENEDAATTSRVKKIMSEMPDAPTEDDLKIITEDSFDEDIYVTSADEFEDGDDSLNESKLHQINQFEEIVERMKILRGIELQIQQFEEEKSQHKNEMFQMRERGESTRASQEHQKLLFDTINEFKTDHQKQKTEIRKKIKVLLPKADGMLKENLMNVLSQLHDNAVTQNSPEVMHRPTPTVRVPPKSPSPRIPSPRSPSPRLPSPKSPSPRIIPPKSPSPPQRPVEPQRQTVLPAVLPSRPQYQSRLPQRQSAIPKFSTKPAIPITSNDPRVLNEIERHKSKILHAENIKKFGNLQNLQQAQQLSKMPRLISRGAVEERNKQHTHALKLARSIGNVKKVGIRPQFQAPLVPSSRDVRAMEVNQTKLKTAASAQRSFLRKPKIINEKTIVDEILGRDELTMKTLIQSMPLEQREKAERSDVLKLINNLIAKGPLFDSIEEAKTLVMKINALRERLKRMFGLIRTVMAMYRGASYIPDDPANNRFIDSILAHFSASKDFTNFRFVLADFFKNMPYPKFKVFQTPQQSSFVPTPSSPSSRIQRPSTTPGRTPPSRFRATSTPLGVGRRQQGRIQTKTPIARHPTMGRRFQASGAQRVPFQQRLDDAVQQRAPVKARIQQQVQNLSQSNLQKSIKEPTTKQKLEDFTNNFCKIFISNQKNRKSSFEIWSKTFKDNIKPILDDLQGFYQSLPYPELKKFDRKTVEKSLHNLLKFVYNETRNKDVNSLQCKKLIGNEMNKLIEGKHLKSLSKAMGIFVEGVKELIRPYLDDIDRIQETVRDPTIRDSAVVEDEEIQEPSLPVIPYETPEFKKRRDESFLKQRGPLEEMFGSLWSQFIPENAMPIFKRVIGFPAELSEIEPTPPTIKALNILLDHCETMDLIIYKVLITGQDIRVKNMALRRTLHDFVEQVVHMVFNNDDYQLAAQINEIRELYGQLEIREMLTAVGSVVFSKNTTNLMLLDPYNFTPPHDEPLINEVLRFIRDVRYMQQKYIWKVLRNEFYGPIEKFGTKIPFDYDSDEELNREENEAQIVAEILSRVRINQPFEVKSRYKPPVDLIERDILYVACQITNREEELSGDKLQSFVIAIAKRYQAREIKENGALRAITQLLQLILCIPVDFYTKFIYNPDNDYFHAITFKDPQLNVYVRNNMLFNVKQRPLCSQDRYMKRQEMNIIVNDLEEFMQMHNNNIDEMIAAMEYELNIDQIYEVVVNGNEVSNNGKALLAIPQNVRSEDLTQGNVENVHISPNAPPITDAATLNMLRILDEVEAQLDNLGGNDQAKSKMVPLVYQLQPNALRRKNFWQSRGSEMPQWFPGIYTVFPDTLLSIPTKSNAPISDLLLHAWRTMAPPI